MRKALRIAWRTLCAIAGAAIGAGLLGFWMHSWTLAAIGAVIGIPLGWLRRARRGDGDARAVRRLLNLLLDDLRRRKGLLLVFL